MQTVKPGVLRFGPSPATEMDLSRATTTTSLPGQTNANLNASRSQTNTNNSPKSAQTTPSSLNKTSKKARKDAEPERDVQSPAYSDISDDSPANDSDPAGTIANAFIN